MIKEVAFLVLLSIVCVAAVEADAPRSLCGQALHVDFTRSSALLCLAASAAADDEPTSWQEHNDLAYAYYLAGETGKAAEHAGQALALNPRSIPSLKLIMWARTADNEAEEVILEALKRLSAAASELLSGGGVGGGDDGETVTFEDHPAVKGQCNYRGFASNTEGEVGGEALDLRGKAEDMYLDLLMRQLTHKSVQRSNIDNVLHSAMGAECMSLGGVKEDPSKFETPWDLQFSVLWANRGDHNELGAGQCTRGAEGLTDNCPATTMAAAQLVMTATLAVQQVKR